MGNANAQLKEAIRQIRNGDREAGKALLMEILNEDPTDDRAWLWMSVVVGSEDLQRECLEEALSHNPHNEQARKALDKLEQQSAVGLQPATDRERRGAP